MATLAHWLWWVDRRAATQTAQNISVNPSLTANTTGFNLDGGFIVYGASSERQCRYGGAYEGFGENGRIHREDVTYGVILSSKICREIGRLHQELCCIALYCAVLCSPTVQLTWMAHDIVVMRTNPELVSLMQKLEEAYQRCKAAVCGAPKTDNSPVPPAGTHPAWYMIVCPTLFQESLQHLEMFLCLSCFKAIDSCRCFSCYAASDV